MKRLTLLLMCALSWLGAQKLEKLVIAGPVASVSHPILRMIESGALNDVAHKVEFRLWQNPDELRALLLKNEAQFVAIPTNVAANLYNKDQPIRLISVPVWGILEIVSRDASVGRIEELKGEEILVPFRADMPDIILQALIIKAGLDPKKEFTLRYVPSPPDAMQMLLLRRAKHVLLAEPATSMVMRKTGSFPVSFVAPSLYRSVNLQQEWGRLFDTAPRIPQAGIAAVGEVDEALVARFHEAYKEALAWCQANPEAAGELVAKHIDFFKPEAVADAFVHTQFEARTAKESQEELEAFFAILLDIEPKLIGGKLPHEGFYGGSE